MKDQILEELNVKEIVIATVKEEFDGDNMCISSDNMYTVGIDTLITPELESEGLAREIVRRIQTLRRQANFDIADHIITFFQSDERIEGVMNEYRGYISKETLSDDIFNQEAGEEACSESFKLDGHPVELGVKRQV